MSSAIVDRIPVEEKRVNPETGVVEEKHWLLGWQASESADGYEERVNPDTGVHEEKHLGGWQASKNADGYEERVNPDTGVHEEKHLGGWQASESADGYEERVNPDTGVHEEKHLGGWQASESADGYEERVNPDTGVHEEKHLGGWQAQERSGPPPLAMPAGRGRKAPYQHDQAPGYEDTEGYEGTEPSGISSTGAEASGGSSGVLLYVLLAFLAFCVYQSFSTQESAARSNVTLPETTASGANVQRAIFHPRPGVEYIAAFPPPVHHDPPPPPALDSLGSGALPSHQDTVVTIKICNNTPYTLRVVFSSRGGRHWPSDRPWEVAPALLSAFSVSLPPGEPVYYTAWAAQNPAIQWRSRSPVATSGQADPPVLILRPYH